MDAGTKDLLAVDSEDIIGHTASAEDIIAALARSGCIYVTALIDYSACGNLPLLGGGFYDVYRGATYGGTPIAIKSVRLYNRPGMRAENDTIFKRVARELYHWSKLSHPNVLPLMGLTMFRGHLSVVSEWMENGSLVSYIGQNPNVDRINLCLDVCTGLSYIHENGMVHGDLKAANILVSRGGTALISDLGNSRLKDLALKLTNTTGASLSVRWAAPELVLAGDGPYTSRAGDVYAFGMTMLEILTGKVPYNESSDHQVILKVALRREIPARPSVGIPDEIWGQLQSCWTWDHDERPAIADIKKRLLGVSTNPVATRFRPGHPEYQESLDLESMAAGRRVYGEEHHDSALEDITECIGRTTTLKEVISALVEQGCQDLTSSIALATCTELPLDGGGFCDVYQGITSDGSKLAIKTLRIFQQPGKDNDNEKIIKRAARELFYWSRLQHPNVLPLKGFALFRERLSMISEWMENGNLMSYIRLNPSVDRIKLCMDICDGLCYIHRIGMVHGDLKAANIMVSPDGKAMVGDFGTSTMKDLALRFTATTGSNFSLRWAAPEVLLQDGGPRSSKADVYAYGMTALETLTGKLPYENLREEKVFILVTRKFEPPARPTTGISDELWNILLSCWADATKRPVMTTVKRLWQNLSDHPCESTKSSRYNVISRPQGSTLGTLVKRDCPDITSVLDPAACSNFPVTVGWSCDVYKGKLSGGIRVAIKSRKSRSMSTGGDMREILKDTASRLHQWSGLNHPNVLPLLGMAAFDNRLSLVSEWMENGSLRSYISLHSDVDRLGLCVDISSGLAYIHANQMAHGAIKPENVMISHRGIAMISDSGNSWLTDLKLRLNEIDSPSLLVRWAAPELMDEDSGVCMSKEADVYACGMTMLETLTGQTPFDGLNEHQVMIMVAMKRKKPARPADGMEDEMWNILQDCWKWDPEGRPEISNVEQRLRDLSATSVAVSRPSP